MDAADVVADFGWGALHGCEGIQGCPPLLPVCGTHPFLPQPDRLDQRHGAVGAGHRLPGHAGGLAARLPRSTSPCSLLVVLLPFRSPCRKPARKWPHCCQCNAARDGEVEERLPLPQWVSMQSSACVILNPLGAPLLGGGATSKALLGGSWVLYQVGLTKLCGEHYSPE